MHTLLMGFHNKWLLHSSDTSHKSMTLLPDLLSFTHLPTRTQTWSTGRRHSGSVYLSHFIQWLKFYWDQLLSVSKKKMQIPAVLIWHDASLANILYIEQMEIIMSHIMIFFLSRTCYQGCMLKSYPLTVESIYMCVCVRVDVCVCVYV